MVSMSEYGNPKGFYHVVDGKATFQKAAPRPVEKFGIDASGIQSIPYLYSNIRSAIDGIPRGDAKPLVEISIHGDLKFPRRDISIEKVREIVSNSLDPLWTNVKITDTKEPITGPIDGPTIRDVERSIIEEVVKGSQYRSHLDDVVDTIIEAKQLAITGVDSQSIFYRLQDSYNTVKHKHKEQVDLPFERGHTDVD